MREAVQKLVDKTSLQEVLTQLCSIAAERITPVAIGHNIVYEQSKHLSDLFYRLDRSK